MTQPRVIIMANNIDEVGGAQRVVHVVAQELARRGYRVQLVGVTPFEPRHVFIEEPAFERRVLMPSAWSDASTDGERDALRARADAALAALLAEGDAGVIVTAQVWAMEQLARVPHDEWAVIGQYHSSFEAAAGGRDLRRVLHSYADVDLVTLLTPADADSFRRAGLNATRWLPNPLAFWPREPATGQARVVGYLGRLSSEKGVRFLLQAWDSIQDQFPQWSLEVIGSGPQEAELRGLAGERVSFQPPTDDAESALRGMGVVVLPSLVEGLPLVMAEAMALGLPVVATDCSAGVLLLAEGGDAAGIVARGDADDLARGLERLLSDADHRARLGTAARHAMERYRAEVVMDQWEQLLAEVLR